MVFGVKLEECWTDVLTKFQFDRTIRRRVMNFWMNYQVIGGIIDFSGIKLITAELIIVKLWNF